MIALLPALLLGCKDRDTTGATGTTESSTESTSAPAEGNQDTGTATASDSAEGAASAQGANSQASAPASSATPPAAGVPQGYTRVPDLSEQPKRDFKEEPDFQLEEGQDYAAVVNTNRGQMVIDLHEDVPTTVNSFVWLARHKFYDGLAFHRVIEGFVVQGGDPNTLKNERNAWGTGGPGYSIPLEIRRKYNFDEKGVLGMARSQDPNSGGSQFYITLAPAPNLDGQYTVFGKVVQGLDVLDQIKKYEAPAEGEVDRMQSVYIVTKNK